MLPSRNRAITESTASVAHRIENQPESVPQEQVDTSIQSAHLARTVLEQATGTTESEGALVEAQAAADYGVAVASSYLVSNLRAQQQPLSAP